MEVKGEFVDVDIPRSRIYVSNTKQELKTNPMSEHDENDNTLLQHRYRFQSDIAAIHFHVILMTGKLYTQEQIDCCQGAFHCFNCTRPIEGKMIFYPTQLTIINEFEVNPIPHCRPACAYRSVQDLPTNKNKLLNLFFLMYGPHIVCAPPRFLLFIPGGLTLEEYHQRIDEKYLITVSRQENIRSFFGVMVVSCTLFKNHQLVKDVVAFNDELNMERKSTIGPSRSRDNSNLDIVELSSKPLDQTKISQVFAMDPNSFQRGHVNPFVVTRKT